MTRLGLPRRHFLGLLGAAAVPLVPGLLPALAARDRRPQEALGASLVALFRHTSAAAEVGRAYLAQSPHEANAERILAAVAGGGSPGSARPAKWRSASGGELLELIRQQIADDVAREDVAIVEGWVLSRTEGRLCGLVFLAHQGARIG